MKGEIVFCSAPGPSVGEARRSCYFIYVSEFISFRFWTTLKTDKVICPDYRASADSADQIGKEGWCEPCCTGWSSQNILNLLRTTCCALWTIPRQGTLQASSRTTLVF